MPQEQADSASPRTLAVSLVDFRLLAFGSLMGGAFVGAVIAFVLNRGLGWHLAVTRGIAMFVVGLSLYAPLKVWNEFRGRRPASAAKLLLAATVCAVLTALLNYLIL